MTEIPMINIMQNWVQILILIAFICAVSGCSKEAETISEESQKQAKILRQKIEREVAELGGDHWAGSYYQGDGLGVNINLTIAPQNGFVFTWHGCLGLYDLNYGQVEEKNGYRLLSFELDNIQGGFRGLADIFLPVKCDERMYLVSENDLVEFCNAINYGSEPREINYGMFLLRNGDHEKTVNLLPALPEMYRSYLHAKPILAKIIKVGDSLQRSGCADINFRDTFVTLNAGKNQGVLIGMKFHVYDPDVVESITVHTLYDDFCEGVMSQIFPDDLLPEVGWKLSTGYLSSSISER